MYFISLFRIIRPKFSQEYLLKICVTLFPSTLQTFFRFSKLINLFVEEGFIVQFNLSVIHFGRTLHCATLSSFSFIFSFLFIQFHVTLSIFCSPILHKKLPLQLIHGIHILDLSESNCDFYFLPTLLFKMPFLQLSHLIFNAGQSYLLRFVPHVLHQNFLFIFHKINAAFFVVWISLNCLEAYSIALQIETESKLKKFIRKYIYK